MRHEGVDKRIDTAISDWARTVFGAPRQIVKLVTNVENLDAKVERVYVEITQRSVKTASGSTRTRQASPPRLTANTVDPFAYTPASLRAASEYAIACMPCRAEGHVRCDNCSGTGTATCRTCRGTGKETKHFKNGNSRLIKCKTCGTEGTVRCLDCGADGRVACRSCEGSGHRGEWLTFEETVTRRVRLRHDGPKHSNPSFEEVRPLEERELEAFEVEALSIGQLAVVLVLSSIVLLAVELEKLIRRRRS